MSDTVVIHGVNWFEVAVSAAFALFFTGGTVLMVLETYLLSQGLPPITVHVRREIANYPEIAIVIGGLLSFAFGALFTHFYWQGAGSGY
jgi:hypothetical protein